MKLIQQGIRSLFNRNLHYFLFLIGKYEGNEKKVGFCHDEFKEVQTGSLIINTFFDFSNAILNL